jgi:hypothetical protein
MKKLLLFAFLACFLTVNSQQNRDASKIRSVKAPVTNYNDNAAAKSMIKPDLTAPKIVVPTKDQRDVKYVNPVEIGQSGNAFGFAFSRTTYLWADNNINSITFIHRMIIPPGTGYLAYDISKDGGVTWENNVQAYNPTLTGGFDARYPQGAIYNPVGNKDPDNAYFHYFAPTLDNSNPCGSANTWGGYAYGVKSLAGGSTPVQQNLPSDPPYYQFLPSAFTVTQTGEAWMVDTDEPCVGGAYTYQGNLIVGRGLWDVDESDFVYNFDLFPLEVETGGGINDVKIAFSPDGLTGYICVMTSLSTPLPYSSYHPVLFKTTDGGDSWSDPIEVQLGGADGLEGIKQYVSDSLLALFFAPAPVPPRDEIGYWMGYECDLSVDAWGNPHIAGTVAIQSTDSTIYTGEGFIAMFHVWSNDQGQTWNAFNLRDLSRFSVQFGPTANAVIQYNRPQVATTQDGAIVFFSWLDTEDSLITDNSQPDIFFREYLPTLDQHGDTAENVTTYSAAMWLSYFGCMSHYVFTTVTDAEYTYTCTIPFVYEQLGTGNDPLLPVKFFYIPDYVRTYIITGIPDHNPGPMAMVAQNYPNPFSSNTSIKVNLLTDSHLSLEVYNITGSMVKKVDLGNLGKGIHNLEFNADGLSKGIYFYSISSGSQSVTKKMIIQ